MDSEYISLYQFLDRIPDEKSATDFFEQKRWGEGRYCPHCGSLSTSVVKNSKPMPFRCKDCRKHFSVRTKTVLAESPIPLKKWLMAIYLLHTARKGVSSKQLERELGVSYKTAWFLSHRIRHAMASRGGLFSGEIEVDEVYIGGKEKNRHYSKRKDVGRGPNGKQPVIGIRQRSGGQIKAKPVNDTDRITLQSTIVENVKRGSSIYSDGHPGYIGLPGYYHEAVLHSVESTSGEKPILTESNRFGACSNAGTTGRTTICPLSICIATLMSFPTVTTSDHLTAWKCWRIPLTE